MSVLTRSFSGYPRKILQFVDCFYLLYFLTNKIQSANLQFFIGFILCHASIKDF